MDVNQQCVQSKHPTLLFHVIRVILLYKLSFITSWITKTASAKWFSIHPNFANQLAIVIGACLPNKSLRFLYFHSVYVKVYSTLFFLCASWHLSLIYTRPFWPNLHFNSWVGLRKLIPLEATKSLQVGSKYSTSSISYSL